MPSVPILGARLSSMLELDRIVGVDHSTSLLPKCHCCCCVVLRSAAVADICDVVLLLPAASLVRPGEERWLWPVGDQCAGLGRVASVLPSSSVQLVMTLQRSSPFCDHDGDDVVLGEELRSSRGKCRTGGGFW